MVDLKQRFVRFVNRCCRRQLAMAAVVYRHSNRPADLSGIGLVVYQYRLSGLSSIGLVVYQYRLNGLSGIGLVVYWFISIGLVVCRVLA